MKRIIMIGILLAGCGEGYNRDTECSNSSALGTWYSGNQTIRFSERCNVTPSGCSATHYEDNASSGSFNSCNGGQCNYTVNGDQLDLSCNGSYQRFSRNQYNTYNTNRYNNPHQYNNYPNPDPRPYYYYYWWGY